MKCTVIGKNGYLAIQRLYDDKYTEAYVTVADGRSTSTVTMNKRQLLEASAALKAMAEATESEGGAS